MNAAVRYLVFLCLALWVGSPAGVANRSPRHSSPRGPERRRRRRGDVHSDRDRPARLPDRGRPCVPRRADHAPDPEVQPAPVLDRYDSHREQGTVQTTDAHGRVQLACSPSEARRASVLVEHDNLWAGLELPVEHGASLRTTVLPNHRLQLTVQDAAGAPQAGVPLVLVRSNDQRAVRYATSAGDGSVALERLGVPPHLKPAGARVRSRVRRSWWARGGSDAAADRWAHRDRPGPRLGTVELEVAGLEALGRTLPMFVMLDKVGGSYGGDLARVQDGLARFTVYAGGTELVARIGEGDQAVSFRGPTAGGETIVETLTWEPAYPVLLGRAVDTDGRTLAGLMLQLTVDGMTLQSTDRRQRPVQRAAHATRFRSIARHGRGFHLGEPHAGSRPLDGQLRGSAEDRAGHRQGRGRAPHAVAHARDRPSPGPGSHVARAWTRDLRTPHGGQVAQRADVRQRTRRGRALRRVRARHPSGCAAGESAISIPSAATALASGSSSLPAPRASNSPSSPSSRERRRGCSSPGACRPSRSRSSSRGHTGVSLTRANCGPPRTGRSSCAVCSRGPTPCASRRAAGIPKRPLLRSRRGPLLVLENVTVEADGTLDPRFATVDLRPLLHTATLDVRDPQDNPLTGLTVTVGTGDRPAAGFGFGGGTIATDMPSDIAIEAPGFRTVVLERPSGLQRIVMQPGPRVRITAAPERPTAPRRLRRRRAVLREPRSPALFGPQPRQRARLVA